MRAGNQMPWQDMDTMLNWLADFIQLEFPHAVEADMYRSFWFASS